MDPEGKTEMKHMKIPWSLWIAAGLCLAAGALAAPETTSVLDLVQQSQKEASRGRMDSALDFARQATERDAGYGGGWKQLGSILLRQEQYDQAVEPLQISAVGDIRLRGRRRRRWPPSKRSWNSIRRMR